MAHIVDSLQVINFYQYKINIQKGHLVGQYPDKFKCAILRNPVLNLQHMVHVSDIPDWAFVEGLGTKVINL